MIGRLREDRASSRLLPPSLEVLLAFLVSLFHSICKVPPGKFYKIIGALYCALNKNINSQKF